MDDSRLVCRFERVRDLPGDWNRFIERNRTPRDAIGKRRSLDELHRQRERASGLLDAENVGDVRMVERGKDFGFALKTREPVGIGRDRRRQDFDRNLALQIRVGRAIHLAHPACSERAEDFVRSEARAWRHRVGLERRCPMLLPDRKGR